VFSAGCVTKHDAPNISLLTPILRGFDKTRLPMLEHSNLRRRGRVVDCGGLENRYTLTGIVGSNPTASAN
jgi:hypothetical protein